MLTFANPLVLCLLATGLTTALLFGGPLHAIALLTIWQDRLGLAYWTALVPLSLILAIYPTHLALRFGLPRVFLPALFVSTAMILAVLLVGTYAGYQRNRVVTAFGAEAEVRSSFLASLRNAPQDFQFFLHGAALRDCKPHAWSYRQMAFYELPPDVAANVLPAEWIQQCNIRRTH